MFHWPTWCFPLHRCTLETQGMVWWVGKEWIWGWSLPTSSAKWIHTTLTHSVSSPLMVVKIYSQPVQLQTVAQILDCIWHWEFMLIGAFELKFPFLLKMIVSKIFPQFWTRLLLVYLSGIFPFICLRFSFHWTVNIFRAHTMYSFSCPLCPLV